MRRSTAGAPASLPAHPLRPRPRPGPAEPPPTAEPAVSVGLPSAEEWEAALHPRAIPHPAVWQPLGWIHAPSGHPPPGPGRDLRCLKVLLHGSGAARGGVAPATHGRSPVPAVERRETACGRPCLSGPSTASPDVYACLCFLSSLACRGGQRLAQPLLRAPAPAQDPGITRPMRACVASTLPRPDAHAAIGHCRLPLKHV